MSKTALLLCLLTIIGLREVSSEPTQSDVVLTSLANPVYPQLAKQARVAGDVELNLSVREDGTLESAEVISGPIMLRQAALDSVHQSHFECRECGENPISYRIVYSFQLAAPEYGTGCVLKLGATYPQFIQEQNHIIVIDQAAGIRDPLGHVTRARSVKCLFLWRCGGYRYPL